MRVLMNFNLTDVTVLGDTVYFDDMVFWPLARNITMHCHLNSDAYVYANANHMPCVII